MSGKREGFFQNAMSQIVKRSPKITQNLKTFLSMLWQIIREVTNMHLTLLIGSFIFCKVSMAHNHKMKQDKWSKLFWPLKCFMHRRMTIGATTKNKLPNAGSRSSRHSERRRLQGRRLQTSVAWLTYGNWKTRKEENLGILSLFNDQPLSYSLVTSSTLEEK